MDLQKLAATLLSADSLSGLSKKTGASKSEVKKVLTQVLPDLLSGAEGQAKNAATAEGFTKALAGHAKDDTGNLLDFLGNVDLEDGAKIIGHLLGGSTSGTTKSVAKKTGVSSSKVGSILSAAGPLLMSLLGQQAEADEDKESPLGDLVGTLLSNVDVGDLLMSLLTDQDSGSKKKTKKKKSTSTLTTLLRKLLK